MTKIKKDNATRFAEDVGEQKKNAKNLLVAKGFINETDVEIEFVIYDQDVIHKGQKQASIIFSQNGDNLKMFEGVVYGMEQPNMPTLFKVELGDGEGYVDVLKMYKSGGQYEGKMYDITHSANKKKITVGKAIQVKTKKRTDELRDAHAVGFKLKIIPEQTNIELPDNTPTNKQRVEPSIESKPGLS